MNEQQMATEAMRTTKEIIVDIKEMLNALSQILQDENNRHNPKAEEIYSHVKKGNKVKSITIPDDNVKIFTKYMEKFDIPYVMTDVDGDNCKVFMYRDIDEKQVEIAIKSMNIELGNQVNLTYDEFSQIYDHDAVSILKVRDKFEAELLNDRLTEQNIPHATIQRENGYDFMLPKEHNKELSMTIAEISWNKTGRNASHYLTLEQERFKVYDFMSKDRETMERIMKQNKNEAYIVDYKHPDNYIKMTEKNIEIYKNNKVIEQHSLDYIPQVIDRFEYPITLTKDQMENKREVLKKKIPEYDTKLAAMEEEYRKLFFEQIAVFYAIHEIDKELAEKIGSPEHTMMKQLMDKDSVIKEKLDKLGEDIGEEITQHMESAKTISTSYEYSESTKEFDRLIREADAKVVENIKERDTTVTFTRSEQSYTK